MVGDEVADDGGEAAELVEQAPAGLGVALDLRELLVGQPGRLAQDLQRHRELADVVQQPADGEVAARGGGELELLADAGRRGAATRRVCSSVEPSRSARRIIRARTRGPR